MCAGSSGDNSQHWSNNGESCCDSECKWTPSTAVRIAVGTARRDLTAHKQGEVCKHLHKNTHLKYTHTNIHKHARSKQIYTILQMHKFTFIISLPLSHSQAHTHTHTLMLTSSLLASILVHCSMPTFLFSTSPIRSLWSSLLSRC